MPVWLQALLVTLLGVVPGVWAAVNVHTAQRENVKIAARKVDQEAFEAARLLWLDGISQLKERLASANEEIIELRTENKHLVEEITRCRDEYRRASALINQLKGALIAAGLKVSGLEA